MFRKYINGAEGKEDISRASTGTPEHLSVQVAVAMRQGDKEKWIEIFDDFLKAGKTNLTLNSFGAGTAVYEKEVYMIAQSKGITLTVNCLDRDQGQIAVAREELKEFAAFNFYETDIVRPLAEDFPLADITFSRIVMEHIGNSETASGVANRDACLTNMIANTKPGGKIIIVDYKQAKSKIPRTFKYFKLALRTMFKLNRFWGGDRNIGEKKIVHLFQNHHLELRSIVQKEAFWRFTDRNIQECKIILSALVNFISSYYTMYPSEKLRLALESGKNNDSGEIKFTEEQKRLITNDGDFIRKLENQYETGLKNGRYRGLEIVLANYMTIATKK